MSRLIAILRELFHKPLHRLPFLGYWILCVFLTILLNVLSQYLEKSFFPYASTLSISFVTGAYVAACLFLTIYMLGLACRRLEDIDKSKWLCIVFLIPFVNFLFLFYLFLVPSQSSKPNESVIR